MKSLILLLTLLIALTLFPSFMALASGGHINATYQQSPLDSLIGVAADYEEEYRWGDFEVDGALQSGDITEGEAHAAVAFNVGIFQVKPFGELNLIRTSDWGHTLDGGAKLNFPIGNFNVAGGVFARNSNAFVPLQTGTRNPITGEEKWDDATPLNFDDLGVLNALLETEFDWHRIEIGLTGIFDLSNQAFHQVIVDAGTNWDIGVVSILADVQYIAQAGTGGGQQLSFQGGVGYKF